MMQMPLTEIAAVASASGMPRSVSIGTVCATTPLMPATPRKKAKVSAQKRQVLIASSTPRPRSVPSGRASLSLARSVPAPDRG